MRETVMIGSLGIGRSFPVRLESMLRTSLSSPDECLREINELSDEGCELVRIAFPTAGLSGQLSMVIGSSPIQVMADIHFDHALAIEAIRAGCSSIRINPGNMSVKHLTALANVAIPAATVIRVGSNAGSLSRSQIEKAGGDVPRALFQAASEQIEVLEEQGVTRIIMSAKSSSISETVKANALLASRFRHPLHVGLTESGTGLRGTIKSCVALSSLLGGGIGDTIRVSMTGPSKEEVITGRMIIQAIGLRRFEPELVSCPGCGRRRTDVASLVRMIEPLLKDLPAGLTVAVMGCEVNGPREASNADIGLAGTPSGVLVFARGRPEGTCAFEDARARFIQICSEKGFFNPIN